jgi:hypothetical protein
LNADPIGVRRWTNRALSQSRLSNGFTNKWTDQTDGAQAGTVGAITPERAMAGGSREHALDAANVTALLHAALGDRPCAVHSADLRVRLSAG